MLAWRFSLTYFIPLSDVGQPRVILRPEPVDST